jgi:Coenzyme PQQ synthesis protein D (PqqD)
VNDIRVGTVLRRPTDVRYRVLDEEGVVVRQGAGEVLVLNDVATRILTLADGAGAIAGWIETLLGEYDVPRPELERDVLAFAAELVEQGLLERVPADERAPARPADPGEPGNPADVAPPGPAGPARERR